MYKSLLVYKFIDFNNCIKKFSHAQLYNNLKLLNKYLNRAFVIYLIICRVV